MAKGRSELGSVQEVLVKLSNWRFIISLFLAAGGAGVGGCITRPDSHNNQLHSEVVTNPDPDTYGVQGVKEEQTRTPNTESNQVLPTEVPLTNLEARAYETRIP